MAQFCRKKALALAITLLVLGVSFLIAGIVMLAQGRPISMVIAFLVLSGICLLPGIYQSVVFYKSIRRQPGFNVEDIPSFDD